MAATKDDWRRDYRLAFPHDYIGAPDLRGKDVTLTISRVDLDELLVVDGKGKGERKQKKLVLSFKELADRPEGQPRKLVANKTNATTIGKLHGSAVEGWIGKQVTLYATTCKAFGETVDCVRIRGRK
jgi:hypothetical protein